MARVGGGQITKGYFNQNKALNNPNGLVGPIKTTNAQIIKQFYTVSEFVRILKKS